MDTLTTFTLTNIITSYHLTQFYYINMSDLATIRLQCMSHYQLEIVRKGNQGNSIPQTFV